MLGHELAVEQAEAALDQPRHQMDQRHLGGVALAAEHALAEERRADRDAVEAADQLAVAPAFDAVGMAARDAARRRASTIGSLIQLSGWPGRGSAQARIDVGESGVGADLEDGRCARCAPAACGRWKPSSGSTRAQPRIEPVELGIVAALAHREDADAIGLQQELGRDLAGMPRAYFFRPTSFSSQWML